ncbi:MAG: dihydroneopterin aldolase [Alphaproteobacteria bacterium]|nr:dihydroneopterin aldolase [Alphaproteobacteria bacterium]
MGLNFANADKNERHVFIHGMKLKASIGIFDHEKARKQMIIIDVDLVVDDVPHDDDIENVVNYKLIVEDIEAYVEAGHVLLVEAMAEKIADICLKDEKVKRALVKIEKPEAFIHVGGVGVAVERCRD